MRIETLFLRNFRNYRDASVSDLSPRVNMLIGANAQGKTNLLEAMCYLSIGRSFRGAPDSRLIRDEEKSARLKGQFISGGFSQNVEIALFADGKKSILSNGLPLRRTGELLGLLNTVVFSPEDLKTVKEGPSLRRRLLDMEISKIRPVYYNELVSYNAVVKQRNKALRMNGGDRALIDVYNQQLAAYAEPIIKRRSGFLEALSKEAEKIHRFLSGEREELFLVYRPSAALEHVKESLLEKLSQNLEREREMGSTMYGPHHEDFSILINGRDARLYGSQGQQRTAILAIKLATVKLASSALKDRPVALLDDVFSELDRDRRERLLSLVDDYQVFITGTDEADAAQLREKKLIRISGGKIIAAED